jgi:hypothetical protein
MTETEKKRKILKPSPINLSLVGEIAQLHFGIHLKLNELKEIESYDDRNFYGIDTDGNFMTRAPQKEITFYFRE